MDPLQYTLVCDGPTDANLIPILNWALRENSDVRLVQGKIAEFWKLPRKPETLEDRIEKALELQPCQLLFVHRDAEKESPQLRHRQIKKALDAASKTSHFPAIAVVPVRMLEAWLVFDEGAIRHAAGNPSGNMLLNLPSLKRVEDRPDPKEDLRRALRDASGHQGRRLKKFDDHRAFWRITDYLQDFSPLRELSAFCQLEESVRECCRRKWAPGFYGHAHA